MNNKRGLYSSIKIEKKMLILQNRGAYIPPQACLRRLRLYKKLHYSLSSFYVLLVFVQYFSLFQILVFQISFSINPIFLIYFSFLYISTIHPYLTSFPSSHLFVSISEEDGGRSLLNCDLHCLGHFLINAAAKAVAHHLMQRQQATPSQKLPL